MFSNHKIDNNGNKIKTIKQNKETNKKQKTSLKVILVSKFPHCIILDLSLYFSMSTFLHILNSFSFITIKYIDITDPHLAVICIATREKKKTQVSIKAC